MVEPGLLPILFGLKTVILESARLLLAGGRILRQWWELLHRSFQCTSEKERRRRVYSHCCPLIRQKDNKRERKQFLQLVINLQRSRHNRALDLGKKKVTVGQMYFCFHQDGQSGPLEKRL